MFNSPGGDLACSDALSGAGQPISQIPVVPAARQSVWRGPIQWLIVCGSLLIAALVIGTAVMVLNFRERALHNSERELENTVLLLTRHFDQQIDDLGVVQRDIAAEVRSAGIASSEELTRWLSGPDMHRMLKNKMSASSYFGALTIFNADGTLINSSGSWPIPPVDISDRPHFLALKSDPSRTVYLSEPVVGRVSGSLALSLALRLNGPNGEFLGMVGRGIHPVQFGKFFASLSLDENATISMFHHNGVLLERFPRRDDLIGRNFREGSPLAKLLDDRGRGTSRRIRSADGEERLGAIGSLSNYPLAIVASTTFSSALANWREQTRFLIVAAGLVTLTVAALLFLIVRRLIAQHRSAQRRLTLEKQRLGTAVDNMTHALVLFDSAGNLVVCNKRYFELYNVPPDVMVPGRSLREILAQRKATGSFKGDVEAYCTQILSQKSLTRSSILETADGRSIQVVHRPVADGGWVTTHEDITERRRSDEQIAHLAHYDALTELPNRVLFRERLQEHLNAGSQLSVLYIDIDEFKAINDSLGHSIGDELLKSVAARLGRCVGEKDFVARLGGDEFAVVQTGIQDCTEVAELVARIFKAIREPFECLGHQLLTDASIGIAMSPSDGSELDQLLKNADLAMYEAKAAGRRTHRFFEQGMGARVKARRTLELDLRQAIVDRQFELHFQPAVNIRTGRIVGCEALLRWKHPVRGMIPPTDFVPIAEETGLISQLGEWVLTTACAEAASWPDHIRLAVNVSPVQLRSQTLALKIAGALAASGLAAERLEIEITEAVLIHDDEAALAILHQLRSIGVRIALDDFGVGYSSLSYLQRFPFDKIKIDRCFIRDITEPNGSSPIVQAVTGIATARDMTTTAEGVETEQQLQVLRSLGCTEMQGFLFSPARPASEIRRLFITHRDSAMPAA